MQTRLRSTVAAMLLLAPVAATLAAPAAAPRAAAAAPSITNMSLNSDAGLSAGATLRVQVQASKDARSASVALGDSGVTVPLRQQAPGSFSGTYVVRRGDRIDPTQMMTARVTVGERTYSRQFNFPPGFQALSMGAASSPGVPGMSIERFVMRPAGRLEPGGELRFRLVGTPGADAWLDIPGVIRGVDLSEVRPGVYEGTYTVRRRDDLGAFPNAVATLRNGDDKATARVDVRGDGDGDRMAGRDGDRTAGRDADRPASRDRGRDDRSPDITDLLPGNGDRIGSRGRVHIGARLSDDASGVDPAGVRLRVNGRDVTSDARVTPADVQYRADLEPGHYTVEVTAHDQIGNRTTKAWSFDVVPEERVGAGPLPMR